MSDRLSPLIQFLRQIAGPPPDRDLADGHLLERFVTARDQAAFAALMQRHGPMVLGVCRRQLHDAHEAEDAFQATFLVLVQKAGSIGRPELLGPWLHGVAYRTAARARQAARRRARERQAAAMPDSDPAVEVVWRELRQVLDEELDRLAQKYRAPLVLFYLEGKTTEEVARQLGCPKGTVLSRLARGRDRLRNRLVRRGVVLSVGLMVDVLMDKAVPAAVPAALAMETVKAAVLTAAGQAAAGAIPATVAALTQGVLQAMLLSKLKIAAAVVLPLTIAVAGIVVGARQAPADKPVIVGNPVPNRVDGQLLPRNGGHSQMAAESSKDAEKIVGTWAILSAERGGQKIPAEMFRGGKWTFAADGKMTSKFRDDKGTALPGSFKLDAAKNPKEITITADNGRMQPCIYQLDGDTLTICLGDSDLGTGRPTEFATKEGGKVLLFVLKREQK